MPSTPRSRVIPMGRKYTLLINQFTSTHLNLETIGGQAILAQMDMDVLVIDPKDLDTGKGIIVETAALDWMKAEIKRKVDAALRDPF